MQSEVETSGNQDAFWLLREAKPSDDKYSRGCVGFVTGSTRYPGAALLGIRTALNLGIGMVRYLGPTELAQLVLLDRPEVVLGMDKAQSWVIGSGIGDEDLSQAKNLELAAKSGLPLVVDAGALQQIELEQIPNPEQCILTPHHREAARLLRRLGQSVDQRQIDAHPETFALEINRLSGIPVLLKSARSVLVVRDDLGQPIVERMPLGNPLLAAAGSGDVLAAILGTLMARAKSSSSAGSVPHDCLANIVRLGCQLHSKAAELLAPTGELGSSRLADFVGRAAMQIRG